jgi:hypothetical protein
MELLRDLNYEDFSELITYLESITDNAAMIAIGSFFPKLNALQELELGYIVESKDKNAFERFKEEYPDLEIDPEGKSQPEEKRYWEVTEKALNHTYDLAFNYLKNNNFKDDNPDKGNTQIYNAKSLAALKNMEYQDSSIYPFKRKLFLDKNPYLSNKEFNKIESVLKLIGVDPNKLMIYVISYCKDKKYNNFNIFLEHLFKRIEILAGDKDMTSQSNKDFLEAINTIINKNK